MVREKIVTIVIGLVVGAMLAGAYFFGPKLIDQTKQIPTPTPTPEVKSAQTQQEKAATKLTITAPQNHSSVTETPVKLTGTAGPNSNLIIFSNADQKQITTNDSGKFETTVRLEEGENEIAVLNQGNPEQVTRITVTLEIE